MPNFANWRVINAQGLVAGALTVQPDGRYRVDFRLWDVPGSAQMLGMRYYTQPENWRRIAHLISDAIYEAITGEKGYFDTRVVFISESGPALRRVKRLTVMDQDGADPKFLTNGDYMVLTPRFNPTAQMIAYMSYIGGKPRVYLFDLETGRQEVLGNFPNMTFSPRFSPDGNRVALTLESGGNSDIYIDGSAQPRHGAPDQRSGHRHRAQLLARRQADRVRKRPRRQPADLCDEYRRHRPAPHQLRLGPRNGTPVWSPRGDLIAFTKQRWRPLQYRGDAHRRPGRTHPLDRLGR